MNFQHKQEVFAKPKIKATEGPDISSSTSKNLLGTFAPKRETRTRMVKYG